MKPIDLEKGVQQVECAFKIAYLFYSSGFIVHIENAVWDDQSLD